MMTFYSRFFVVAAVPLSGALVLSSARSADAQTTVASSPVGVVAAGVPAGQTGVAFPLTPGDVFVGVVESNAGASLAFGAAHGNIGALLTPGRPYYLEVLSGTLEGERLDVDTEQTIAMGSPIVLLALGVGSHSTVRAIADGALAGARCALRPHIRLADLRAMFSPALQGDDVPGRADGVWLLEKGEFRFYHSAGDNAAWVRPGSTTDVRSKVIPPDTSLIVERRAAGAWIVNAGNVRLNVFRKNLSAGLQAFATGFPIDLTPAQARAFVDPGDPAENRWTAGSSPAQADEIRLVSTIKDASRLFLDADGTTWRTLSDPTNLANEPVLRALGMVVVKRKTSDPAYRIPPPFEF